MLQIIKTNEIEKLDHLYLREEEDFDKPIDVDLLKEKIPG